MASRQLLSPSEVVKRLSGVPAWRLAGSDDEVGIQREFRFKDYHETMAFVNAVAFLAHKQDHHPDLSVHYNRCVVRFSTHSAKGLTELDFECASRVDALAA